MFLSSGKKVLTDFQEATQSHKVQQQLSQPPGKTNSNKNVKKVKKREQNGNEILKDLKINESKISLLLIEDADIVFEEYDEGFYSAVSSLVQTSKRPFIFVTNDPTCSHLDNFRTQQCLVLEMNRPSFHKSCKF